MEPEPPRPPKGEIAKLAQPAFEELVQFVEAQGEDLAASQGADAGAAAHETQDYDGFARLVSEALDDLPLAFRWELERNVPVVISDDGASHGAYGMFCRSRVAASNSHFAPRSERPETICPPPDSIVGCGLF